MSERTLHLIAIYALQIGWIIFAGIFIFRKRPPGKKTRKTDWTSLIGIVIQTLSLPAVWMSPSRHRISLPLLGFWFQLVSTTLVVAVILISLWTMWSAVRALGKQWSLQA